MVKIVDKVLQKRRQARQVVGTSNGGEDDFYYSFEFFPPKTEAGLDNLLYRIERMTQRLGPLFITVTWGAMGSTSVQSMAVASHAQKFLGVDVLLHLTTQGMKTEDIKRHLLQAKLMGIQNLLVLRGDPPRGKKSWEPGDLSGGDFPRAIDLVKFIRQEHGSYFGIAVAGHPEGHPSSTCLEDEIAHLKEKIDAGADFILTQFVYDVDVLLSYVKKCRSGGIECPIIPGIMPIQSYNSLSRMTKYCNVSVPQSIMNQLEPIKNDDQAVKEVGCQIAIHMCHRILKESHGDVDGIHFYTLNLERSATHILMQLGAVDWIQSKTDEEEVTRRNRSPSLSEIGTRSGRALPWRPSAIQGRSEREDVRPINWANRPKSYVMRTEDWDEFPNGRWGDSSSPTFGEWSTLSHFMGSTAATSDDERRNILGHSPQNPPDIWEVFAKFVERKIPFLPWCESTQIQMESFPIAPELAQLNRSGFLTINSQPAVNGVPSVDKIHGWGGPGGFVYQKAYCECFCSPEHMSGLIELVRKNESMSLYAVNYGSREMVQEGHNQPGVTALTWGVFPNQQILQPTIFDPDVFFMVWSEEAFSLWTTMWLTLYDFESESHELLETIRDTYFLCAIIENDFVNGTVNQSLKEHGMTSFWQKMLAVVPKHTGEK